MSTWSDLKVNPRLRGIYDTRIKIIRLIRDFFWSRDFMEVETPVAVRYPGQEPYLNPVPAKFADPFGKEELFYLQTSPEFAMKKLLAAGYSKIFQLAKCFRNNESFGGVHNTEFTMLEWYRAPGSLEKIMDDTEELFKYVGRNLGIKKLKNCQSICHSESPAGGEESLSQSLSGQGSLAMARDDKMGGVEINCEWGRKSMKEIWKEYINVDLNDYLEIKELRKLAEEKKYKTDDSDAYDDIFYKIFLTEIEPKLGLEKPIFIYDYPAGMCSLSRLCENDKRYAERFELYAGGLELANAFGELTDAQEQKTRLEGDKKLRRKLGKETWPVDPDFISALDSLPGVAKGEAGGIALGTDRMILLFTGARDLNEAIFQSVRDQID